MNSRTNIVTEDLKTLKILIFANYVEKCDRKFENFVQIQRNVSEEKRKFQYVLLK